jgi:hypothetical protein
MLRQRAEDGTQRLFNSTRNNRIDAYSLAFSSCHHDTSSLRFYRFGWPQPTKRKALL